MTKAGNFLNCITIDQMHSVISNSPKLYTFQTKTGEIVNSDKLFWEAVIITFPLNPPLRSHKVIGALADSIFGGLLSAGHPKVDILWLYADSISRPFSINKVEFFNNVAFSVSPDDEHRVKHNEGGVRLRLFLVCSNEDNRKALETEFSILDLNS